MNTEAHPASKDFSSGKHLSEFLQLLPSYSTSIGIFDEFNPESMNRVLLEIREYMKEFPCSVSQKKRVYSMAVECFDNIRNYYNEDPTQHKPSLLVFTVEGEHLCITAGNRVSKAVEADLKARLELLQKLNKEELNGELAETIILPNNRKGNGAGLGLIMMGWRSGNYLDYFFENTDNESSFFYIRIKIAA